MEGVNKNQVIVILIILNLIFFVSMISFGKQVSKNKRALLKETNVRFDLEEKDNENAKKIAQAQEQARSLQQDLEEERSAHEVTRKALGAAQEELDKITKLKNTLEEDLKEALVK